MKEVEDIVLLIKMGESVQMPRREVFSHFPVLRVIKVVKDGVPIGTEFFPGAQSVPSTRHPKTIRLVNLNWNGVDVRVLYDSTSKQVSLVSGNVDSVSIRVI